MRIKGAGAKSLARQIERTTKRAMAAATAAVQEAADDVAEDARQQSPRDSGELVESIEVADARQTGLMAEAAVEVSAPHAGAVEYGTADTAAQPFLRPAVEGSGPRAVRQMAAKIKRGLGAS